jgi:bacillithiol synthase
VIEQKGRELGMTIVEIPNQKRSSFMEHYMEHNENMLKYFDYVNLDEKDIHERYKELNSRSFPREELSNYFATYHQNLPNGKKVKDNIQRIKDPKSVVVVGGQQAGLLTGPLYSIHKCITIIKYAEESERTLGTPVIPVFWIAGEDHDYDEVNHVFVPSNQKLKKIKYGKSLTKQSLSEMDFSPESILSWSKELIQDLGETKYTKDVYELIQEAVECSHNYTEFFAFFIAKLFSDYGLLLLDSADHKLRKIESPFFRKIIENNNKIDEAFRSQSELLRNDCYPLPIEVQDNNAHLFINVRNERVLLYRNEAGEFVGKNRECLYTTEQLLDISKKEPHLLSNNVVTRPLMQEFLLPTLSFVGGPGEIAYWSTLRGVFHLFDVKIPPLLPRLTFTLIEPKVQKIAMEKNLDIDVLIQQGASGYKKEYMDGLYDWNLREVVSEVKQNVENTHRSLSGLAHQVSRGLDPMANKNLAVILSQIDFLGDNIEKEVNRQNQHDIDQFDYINSSILPMGIPQERVWNIFYYLNHYGFHFIKDLLDQNYSFNGTHKVYYL